MKHIKSYFAMALQILKKESDGDLMYWLESINTGDEALEIIKNLRQQITDIAYEELTKEMSRQVYHSKEELVNMFGFIIEKQRGYPLGMGELSDIEDWASSWADDHHYEHLFRDINPSDYKDELFSYLNHLQFATYDSLCLAIRCWYRDEHYIELKDDECMELASDFVDCKELYDISYDE